MMYDSYIFELAENAYLYENMAADYWEIFDYFLEKGISLSGSLIREIEYYLTH